MHLQRETIISTTAEGLHATLSMPLHLCSGAAVQVDIVKLLSMSIEYMPLN